jgi:hypothetical protein
MTPDEILTVALRLDHASREKLVRELLLSFDEPADEELSEAEIERLWLAEAERRAREMREGKVKGISFDQAVAKARALLKRFQDEEDARVSRRRLTDPNEKRIPYETVRKQAGLGVRKRKRVK